MCHAQTGNWIPDSHTRVSGVTRWANLYQHLDKGRFHRIKNAKQKKQKMLSMFVCYELKQELLEDKTRLHDIFHISILSSITYINASKIPVLVFWVTVINICTLTWHFMYDTSEKDHCWCYGPGSVTYVTCWCFKQKLTNNISLSIISHAWINLTTFFPHIFSLCYMAFRCERQNDSVKICLCLSSFHLFAFPCEKNDWCILE